MPKENQKRVMVNTGFAFQRELWMQFGECVSIGGKV